MLHDLLENIPDGDLVPDIVLLLYRYIPNKIIIIIILLGVNFSSRHMLSLNCCYKAHVLAVYVASRITLLLSFHVSDVIHSKRFSVHGCFSYSHYSLFMYSAQCIKIREAMIVDNQNTFL